MMTMILKASGIAIAAVALMGAGARAASADELVEAKVPFPFVVGGVRLPAGSYVVRQMADGSSVVAVSSSDGHQFVCTTTIPSQADQPTSQAELVFDKFGNEYFLSRIVPAAGSEREIVLTPSIMEYELAKVRTEEPAEVRTDAIR